MPSVLRTTAVHAPSESRIAVASIPVDPMLTTQQVANILSVSEETLKKWRQRSKGPSFVRYHDGAVRYRLSTITQFLSDNTVMH